MGGGPMRRSLRLTTFLPPRSALPKGKARAGGASHAAYQAPIPRRPCRLDPALRRHQGRARQAREGRDHRRRSSRRSRTARSTRSSSKQEEVGLKLATDGEYRRSWWHLDFFWGLTGVEKITLPHGIKFHGVETRPEGYKITGKIDFPSDHPMLEHFKYLKAHTRVTPKMCIPAPTVMHFRRPRTASRRASIPTSTATSPTSARPTPRR